MHAHSSRRGSQRRHGSRALCAALALAGLVAAWPVAARAQGTPRVQEQNGDVQLDFDDVELSAVIDTIARMTNKNFIYDDRVRGRVTIVSPTPISVDQAYAVFESVLQVKGFTTVKTPGGAIKIVPVRDAKESSIETSTSAGPPANRDHYVTRLIPLRYIEAESIVNTLKPLVSKDAAMAAYGPTNTVILTESASNIRRILSILESIDVITYKEELAVIRVEHADSGALAEQISEIYGAEVETPTSARRNTRANRRGANAASAGPTIASAVRGTVRILTDARTNSLIVLASRPNLEEVRQLVRKLDVPVTGGGRIHVRYLKNANAEELAQTLSSMLSGQPRATSTGAGAAGAAAAAGGGQARALRGAVAGLDADISVTADPATNSLVIQASQEGFNTLSAVIDKLDVQRPQVLVEALIMEVDVTDVEILGLNALLDLIDGENRISFVSLTDVATQAALTGVGGPVLAPFAANLVSDSTNGGESDGTLIQSLIRAAAFDNGTNVLSAPHILTSDNEQAEIRIGDNIPIISSRVQSAAGVEAGLSTSVNVERQDVGVTLRVTPQITEGSSLRLEIFQEITSINSGLQEEVGNPEDVGVPLSNRRIENTVVVEDSSTIVIGGLISEDYQDVLTKVPFLGDIPILGWLFKTTDKRLQKVNLLVFLTPHIIRDGDDLELETIRKREEFADSAADALDLNPESRAEEERRRQEALALGEPYEPLFKNPVRTAVLGHENRYPLERMREIEQENRLEREKAAAAEAAAATAPSYYVQAALLRDETKAVNTLTELVDAGYDGALISGEVNGEMLYEVRIGPYPNYEDAQRASAVVRSSHGLRPSVLVVEENAE